MESVYTYVPGLWLYILSAVVLVIFMAAQLPRIHLPLARRIFYVLLTAFIWNFFLIFEFMVSSLELKLLYARIQYIGIIWLPLAWIALITELSSYRRNVWIFGLASIVPIFLMFVILFAPIPNFFWGVPTLEDTSIFPIVNFHYSNLYYVGFLPFTYLMLLISIIILWRNYGTNHPHYRRQKLLLTLALSFPGIINLLYNFDLSPIPGLNLTTASLTISGVFFYVILYRNALLDLIPISRDQIVEHLDEAVLIFNNKNRLIDFNQTSAELLRLGRGSIGLPVEELHLSELTQAVENPAPDSIKFLILLNSQVYELILSVVKERQAKDITQAIIVLLRDITREQLLTQQLQLLAQRDSLTGLYNRRTLFSKSNELLEENPTTTMWAIMVDVDNFKMINDSHGHAYGDLILQTIGESLQSFTSPILIAGRLGGDEFVIITTDPDIKSLASAINSQILQRIDVVRKNDQPVTLSMGVSCLNLATYTDENPLEQLILEADQALYRAKDQGKNQIFFATGRRTRRTFTKQEH